MVDTAFEEGREEGEAIGIQLTLKTIRLYNQDHSIVEIAKIVEKTIEFVEKVLKAAGLVDWASCYLRLTWHPTPATFW